jgi:uncharacterized repeat protein (TIGR01451 family)
MSPGVLMNLARVVLLGVVGIGLGAETVLAQTPTGPVFPPPGGVIFNDTGSDAFGDQGRAGGRTFRYDNFNLCASQALYYGLNPPVVVSTQGGTGTLNYSPSTSNLPGGIAQWTGTTFLTWTQPCAFCGPTTVTAVGARLTLTVTDVNNVPLPLTDAATVGLGPLGAVLTVTGSFKATLLAEIQHPGSGVYGPILDVFDTVRAANGGGAVTDVSAGFWYLPAQSDLAVTKTDGTSTAYPGAALTYTITVTNLGNTCVNGATVSDNFPGSLVGVGWTCSPSSGSSCSPAGGGNIADFVNLLAGGSATYTVNAMVHPAATGMLTNTASAAVPGGTTDPNPANNSASDTDQLIACGDEIVVVPDGRLTETVIPGGATAWFGASLRIGNSYSLEFKNTTGGSTAPGALTVFSGDDGCSGTSTLVTTNTADFDPPGGAGAARQSFTATGTATYFRARLVNGPSPIPTSFSWSDTTMFSPAWSDNGSFDTFYSFQNTTEATLNGTLTLLNPSGTLVISHPLTIAPGQTASTNTLALGIARNQAGTAKFTHNGPPGAIIAEAAIANFSISPAYVQPVKFQALREGK